MANKRSISTMRPTPSEKQRGPQSLPLRMENFGGAGKPESSKHFSAEIAAFASLWSVILGKRGLVFNSLTFSCYLASILCKNAEMPHFRAAFLLCIFFINTFWRSGWDSNPRNLAVQLISSQSRYDHFDTAPYLSQHQHLGKRGELMGRTSKNIKLRIPEKPHKIKGFRSGSYRVATTISSQV